MRKAGGITPTRPKWRNRSSKRTKRSIIGTDIRAVTSWEFVIISHPEKAKGYAQAQQGAVAGGTSAAQGSQTGIAVNFSAEKCFGFILPDNGGENVFFHITALVDANCLQAKNVSVAQTSSIDEKGTRGPANRICVHWQEGSCKHGDGCQYGVASRLGCVRNSHQVAASEESGESR